MTSISLHPKFGVNPSLAICNWCGKETGEIAMLGANHGKEAPRHIVLDDEPCSKCQEAMSQGITVILMDGATRLAWAVAREEAFLKLLNEDVQKQVKQVRRCMVTMDTWKVLGLEYKPEGTDGH